MTSAQETIHCFPLARSFDVVQICQSVVALLWLLNVSTRGYILISSWEHSHTQGDILGMEIFMAFKKWNESDWLGVNEEI